MKIKLEKKDGEYKSFIVQTDGATIPFDYIAFLKGLDAASGLLITEYSEEIDENERKVMEELFKKISEVFSEKNEHLEEEEVDY